MRSYRILVILKERQKEGSNYTYTFKREKITVDSKHVEFTISNLCDIESLFDVRQLESIIIKFR